LLALYRYWNIIRYWFPYRDLIGEDWDAVLKESIPRVALAGTTDAYKLEMMALIARIHDTHANLWSSLAVRPPVGEHQLPVVARFVEGQAVITHLLSLPDAGPSPFRIGDIIEAIDGVSVTKLVKTWTPYYAASNEPTRLRDIARSLTNGPAGEVQLTVGRPGGSVVISAARVPIASVATMIPRTHDLPGEAFQLLSKDVAYLKLSAAKGVDLKDCIKRAGGTKGLIIDIRNYPSDFVVFTLGGLLVDQPAEFTRFTNADLANPGAFHFTPPLKQTPAAPHYAGRVIILIDEVSQSNAEYTTMALRVAPRAVVVGSTTAAADGNASTIPLPGGLRTMISGIGVFYPDKRPTQRVGIIADIEAKPTIAGIRAGRDEVLEEGLRQILGPETPESEIREIGPAPANVSGAPRQK
jgi:C-terminal processing protease CtpA/Prc